MSSVIGSSKGLSGVLLAATFKRIGCAIKRCYAVSTQLASV